jgi:endo-1,4-beta-mannosidase
MTERSPAPFRVGINYWPASTAMGWWRAFDRGEVGADFMRIAAAGFDSVRLFLTWEDFQPNPSQIDRASVRHLIAALDEASAAGLRVMPTLFTGHMSGVNWIPRWALGGASGDPRFRVVAAGRIEGSRIASWYTDEAIGSAQEYQAGQLARALAGHRALWAWDLGNENSNCTIPPDKGAGRRWLGRMADAIRHADPGALVTLGLHMEDLEQDRNIGPREAAEHCDFLTMHGYPGYAPWTDGPTDERLLPFLAQVTRWLAGGADVLFSEFGVPTTPPGAETAVAGGGPALVSEPMAAEYVGRALAALHACGSTGAMLWCYADYVEALWNQPPFDSAVHERTFGLWRSDHSAKPAVAAVGAFVATATESPACVLPRPSAPPSWIDLSADQFYFAPAVELPRLFRRYCEVTQSSVGVAD